MSVVLKFAPLASLAACAVLVAACSEHTPCEIAYCVAWCESRAAECVDINDEGGFVCVAHDPYSNVNMGTLEAATETCSL